MVVLFVIEKSVTLDLQSLGNLNSNYLIYCYKLKSVILKKYIHKVLLIFNIRKVILFFSSL